MKKITLMVLLVLITTQIAQARIACRDFYSQSEAQAYYDAGRYQWYLLDKDNDGIACEVYRY